MLEAMLALLSSSSLPNSMFNRVRVTFLPYLSGRLFLPGLYSASVNRDGLFRLFLTFCLLDATLFSYALSFCLSCLCAMFVLVLNTSTIGTSSDSSATDLSFFCRPTVDSVDFVTEFVLILTLEVISLAADFSDECFVFSPKIMKNFSL